MNLFEFDGVEAQKADAMTRYRRQRFLLNVLRTAEAAAAVALLGYWWLPTTATLLEIAGDWFRRIGAVLDSGLAIFVIVNVLIISIVVLSHENTENEPDLYDQFISATAPACVSGAVGGVCPAPEERDNFLDKQIVPASPRIDSVAERLRKVGASTAEPNQVVRCEAVTTVKQVKNYRRTRSERRAEQPRRLEYRRSETATVHRERVTAWRSRAMEGLSSEEFRMTIETFIMETKRTLLQENDVVQWQVQRRGLGDDDVRVAIA